MATDRCFSIDGPCYIETCDGSFVTEGDVVVDVKQEFQDQESSLAGKVGKRLTKTVVEIKFTPLPLVSYAARLFPWQPQHIGQSLYGCTDCFLKIRGRDGLVRNYKCAAVKKPPQLRLSSRQNLYGEVTYGAVVANNTDVGVAGNVVTLTSAAFVEPAAASNPALWIARCGQAAWGTAAPYNALHTDEGITVDVTYGTKPKETDCNGVVDEKITEVSCLIKMTPSNLSQADFAALVPEDGPQAKPGYSLIDRARQLVVTHSPAPGGLRFTAFKAAAEAGALRWGREVSRYGEITFQAMASVDSGTNLPNPLFLIEVVP